MAFKIAPGQVRFDILERLLKLKQIREKCLEAMQLSDESALAIAYTSCVGLCRSEMSKSSPGSVASCKCLIRQGPTCTCRDAVML